MGYDISYTPVISIDQTKSSHNGPTDPPRDDLPSLVDTMRRPKALKPQPRYAKDGLGSDPTCS